MLRRSNPPAPLGPTAAHIPAPISMLYTLTFRVFLLAVATRATITGLEAFKKIYIVQTCTPGPLQPAPGTSSLLRASAPRLSPRVLRYLWDAERIVLAIVREDSIGYGMDRIQDTRGRYRKCDRDRREITGQLNSRFPSIPGNWNQGGKCKGTRPSRLGVSGTACSRLAVGTVLLYF